MIPKKYVNDYRLENFKSSNGKVCTRAVYSGQMYTFAGNPDRLKALKRGGLLLEAAACLMFGAGLFVNGALPRQFYVIVPYFSALLPYLFMWLAWLEIKPGSIMTRQQKDGGYERLRISALLAFIFTAAATIGGAVALMTGRSPSNLTGDLVFFTLTALQAAIALTLLISGKAFCCIEAPGTSN